MKPFVASWSPVGTRATSPPFRRGALTRPVHQAMVAPAAFTLKYATGCAACSARIEAGVEVMGFKPVGAPRFIIWHNLTGCIEKMTVKGMYGTGDTGSRRSETAAEEPWLKAYDEQS